MSRYCGPENMRNVCILAHVDHGKTSVADSLLSLNGMVSKRSVGVTKFLDNRQDEQERGITMKSSAVLLADELTTKDDDVVQNVSVILNLIDTPGHIDFSSEVIAAVRISDSAIIVVDVVDGVSAQTKDAIKHAFDEKLKMLLIINKIDRLILELKQSSTEMFYSILRSIEDCNAHIASLTHLEMSAANSEKDNVETVFAPDIGNVIFASALDGWGFTLESIARIYVNVVKDQDICSLTKKLWDFDCYINSKTKQVCYGAINKNKPNLFVQLVTSMLDDVYTNVAINGNLSRLQKWIEKLNIKNIPAYSQYGDPRSKLRASLQAWKPLSRTILRQAYICLPSPMDLDKDRIDYLLNKHIHITSEKSKLFEMTSLLLNNCSKEARVLAYFSKRVALEKIFRGCVSNSRDNREFENIDQKSFEILEQNRILENYEIVSLTRIFSGNLHCGQQLHLIGSEKQSENVTVSKLYILSGRKYESVNVVPAGYMCGAVFENDIQVKTGTLTDTLPAISIIEMKAVEPILSNLITSVNQDQFAQLVKGLKLLEQTDSGVQVTVNKTGEYMLSTTGEVHLDKCTEDLKNIFAYLKFNVSPPIYSLRETVDPDGTLEIHKCKFKLVEGCFMDVNVSVTSLREEVVQTILHYSNLLKAIRVNDISGGSDILSPLSLQNSKDDQYIMDALNKMKLHLSQVFKTSGYSWSYENIWSVVDQNENVNVLINRVPGYSCSLFMESDKSDPRVFFNKYMTFAFKRIAKAGPLCEEPLMNCAFVVDEFAFTGDYAGLHEEDAQQVNFLKRTFYGILRDAFMVQTPALMEPILSTNIQTDAQGLGKLYSQVHRRFGRIIENLDLDENHRTFVVKALIPALESLDFANAIRRISSGGANPTLTFSHYQIVNTGKIEENIDSSEETESEVDETRTQKLQNSTRRRKGLPINEQIVIHAEKQRTLKK